MELSQLARDSAYVILLANQHGRNHGLKSCFCCHFQNPNFEILKFRFFNKMFRNFREIIDKYTAMEEVKNKDTVSVRDDKNKLY